MNCKLTSEQVEASPSVVKACETIVRAHEACVATLNTEYQVRHHRHHHHLYPKYWHNIPIEEFPQGNAFSFSTGQRASPRRFQRTTIKTERSTLAISMDGWWNWIGALILLYPPLLYFFFMIYEWDSGVTGLMRYENRDRIGNDLAKFDWSGVVVLGIMMICM